MAANPGGNRSLCWRCVHFGITFDMAFPYRCMALGFATRQLPSQAVVDASGYQCLHFVAKKPRQA